MNYKKHIKLENRFSAILNETLKDIQTCTADNAGKLKTGMSLNQFKATLEDCIDFLSEIKIELEKEA